MSRDILREALNAVEARGLLDARNGDGTCMARPDSTDLGDMLRRILIPSDSAINGYYEIRLAPEVAAFDGHHSMPITSSLTAMRTAVGTAKSTGIACATVSNSGHSGAAGYYAHVAAWQDCIGMSMCSVDPAVAVPGSRGAVPGTNPLAYEMPDGKGKTVFLDIATSVVAAGKIYQAQAAGHKGYGLAPMVEILAGLLSGGAFGRDVVSWVTGRDPVNQSLTFIAISIEAFMPIEAFSTRMAGIAQEIRTAPTAVGAERIYLPGEKEWENREIALRQGLLLPPDVIASLEGLAEDCGLGIGWRRAPGKRYDETVEAPLRDALSDDLARYPWPELSHPARFAGLADRARAIRGSGSPPSRNHGGRPTGGSPADQGSSARGWLHSRGRTLYTARCPPGERMRHVRRGALGREIPPGAVGERVA